VCRLLALAVEGPLIAITMSDLIERARQWIAGDPDPETRAELQALIDAGDEAALADPLGDSLTFGTAGIRGVVGAGPSRMNRAVIIRTTYGLAQHLIATEGRHPARPVIVGFDARPTSRRFAQDTAGVLAAAEIPVIYFPEVTPTPLVAFAAKHLDAAAAVVVTASHNPPADNGYKVYGPDAAQIVPPVDIEIQKAIETAPPAVQIARVESPFEDDAELVRPVPGNIIDSYWEEVAATRSRGSGSSLGIIYTPIHGVAGDLLLDVMSRAGHRGVTVVPEQAEPDGAFPTVSFPNPEEPGALDRAIDLATARESDLVIANDPDGDRLAAVIPSNGDWRRLSGNEVGLMLADYILAHRQSQRRAIVASSIVSCPMLGSIAAKYDAHHAVTLTGFKWIVRAGLALESQGVGEFVFGYEEALGYTVGSTVRDKDGISAALIFTDLVADLADEGLSVLDHLSRLWDEHGLWVSAQTSISRPGADGLAELEAAVERLADDPPEMIGDRPITALVDYRRHADQRPPWLGEQALVAMELGDGERVLVRPSGTEPKLKIYVDLKGTVSGDPVNQQAELEARAAELGETLRRDLGF